MPMTKKQKQDLARLEKRIIRTTHYIEGHGFVKPMSSWDGSAREDLKQMLEERRTLLNEMFICSADEVADFKKTNDRLHELTQKMHAKALSLYRAILQNGYDPEFDDDIMVEGTLRYVYNDPWESVILSEEEKRNIYEKPINPYGSDFPTMLDILSDYYEHTWIPECASCSTSYELYHDPGMDAKEVGLDDFLDNGVSWDEGYLRREEFKDICICHAVHDLCEHKMYSIPDLLRMNDFWCEIKITHQLISDRDGKRFSCIRREEE